MRFPLLIALTLAAACGGGGHHYPPDPGGDAGGAAPETAAGSAGEAEGLGGGSGESAGSPAQHAGEGGAESAGGGRTGSPDAGAGGIESAGGAQAEAGAGGDTETNTRGGRHGNGGHENTGGGSAAAGRAGAGAVDIDLALNRPPVLEDVEFASSSFACGPSLELCATARDPDADPIEFELTTLSDCSVEATLDSPMSQCWAVTCPAISRANLIVRVYDLAVSDGAFVRIEQLLPAATEKSHAELALHATFNQCASPEP